MMLLLYYWNQFFDEVSFLYMDEFDAFYHYDLSERVMRMILDKENMQSVLTSHNTVLITNGLMRPDCYMIMDGKHNLRSMSESTMRELRQGHSLERLYRNGEFDE